MHKPRVFVFVHPAYTDMICYPQTLNVWESFERCGAIVRYGNDIRSIDPRPGDKLVGYGRLDEYRDVADRFPREDKWHYVVDESSSTSQPYDKAMSYMKLLNVGNIIVTYQNKEHLDKLTTHGIRYVVMPQTFPVIRQRVSKEHGVLLSGQVSDSFYPVRTKAWRALESGLPRELRHVVDTPGQDISAKRHDIIRERYYELLDRCRMGVVCRAGHRDRFVAKYIEMGACHVLPVGDCPTYMPDEMKKAMVDVSSLSSDETVAEVRRLLVDAPDELQERTDAFTACVERYYMATPNMQRVLDEITKEVP